MLNEAIRDRESNYSLSEFGLMGESDPIQVLLVPFAFLDAEKSWSISDEYLSYLWDRLVREDQAGIIFMENEVASAREFIDYMKADWNFPVIGFVMQENPEPVFVAWINTLGKNNALCHFLTFKTAMKYNRIKAGKVVLDYWFAFKREDGSDLFDVLLGRTPASLRAAVSFIRKLGFKVIGQIPKIYAGQGAVISFLLREDFTNGRKSKTTPSESARN